MPPSADFDFLPLAYQSLDERGRILAVNARWLDVLGRRRDEVVGQPFADFLADDADRAAFGERFPRFCASGVIRAVPFTLRHAGGGTRHVEFDGSIERDAAGRFVRTHCVFRDVTERRAAQAAAQGVREAERALLDAIPGFAALVDRDLRFVIVNASARRALGLEDAPAAGRAVSDLLPAAVSGGRRRQLQRSFRERIPLSFEDEAGGRKLRHDICPVADDTGAIPRVAWFTRDVTQERATEGTLQSLLRAAPIGVGLVRDRTLGWTNETLGRLLGYRAEELLGQSARMLYPDDAEFERVAREKYPQLERGGVGTVETRMRRKDGRLLDVLLSSAAVDPATPGADLVFTVVDTSELRRSRAELDLHNRIATAFLTAAEDETYPAVLDVLRAATDSPYGLFGYIDGDGDLVCPTLTGEVWQACRLPDKTARFPRAAWGGLWGRVLEERRSAYANGGLQVPEGHIALRSVLGVPLVHQDELVGVVVVADRPGGYGDEHVRLLESLAARIAPIVQARREADRHRAEREELEAQVRQAQKMEALGQLAGGVAHDFNNLLQAIAGNAELALGELPPDSLEAECVEEIEHAADRAARLTQQLLAFSRRRELERRMVDPADVVHDVLKLLRRVLGEHVDLVVQAAPALRRLHADPGQLEQVLLNLCINARDAMPDGGQLTIALANQRVEGDDAARPLARPGEYVRLSVRDTGAGIPEEHRERIFDPFFTTKGVGEGTGLGLATVFGIVEQHGGWIEVESALGEGTTFQVFLPVATDEPATSSAHLMAPDARGGSETILLAEDEDLSRRVVRRILERAGYALLIARDGPEALALVEQHAATIDGAVLDVVMPGASGRAVAEELRRRNPQAGILFSTGYSARVIDAPAARAMGGDLIQKPYAATLLLERLRALLDRREP